jgi:hypothetical protein
MAPSGIFFKFLLLAYNGSTFGSYGQVILYSVLRFVTIPEQKEKTKNYNK